MLLNGSIELNQATGTWKPSRLRSTCWSIQNEGDVRVLVVRDRVKDRECHHGEEREDDAPVVGILGRVRLFAHSARGWLHERMVADEVRRSPQSISTPASPKPTCQPYRCASSPHTSGPATAPTLMPIEKMENARVRPGPSSSAYWRTDLLSNVPLEQSASRDEQHERDEE